MSGLRRSGFKSRGKPLENKGGGLERRARLKQVSPRKSDRRKSDEEWSERVLTRDRYTCQAGPDGQRRYRVAEVECAGRRDPHHIIPREHEATRHEDGNGVTLCRAHHDWVHFQAPAKARRLGLKADRP